MKSLNVFDLSFSYDKKTQVIKDVNLEFKPKKIYTLLGLNGSGKTTLIKLLAGLFYPDEGNVFLDKESLKQMKYLERSQHISYVRQGLSTGDDHFVKDYLSFGLTNQISWYSSPKKEHLEYVVKKAEQFKIGDLLEKRMNEISGGQKQIVMICRAFIQNTDIIILDEPTSALDFKNQSLVLRLLRELVEKEEKTIILSTHNPNHALYLQSEVVLMDAGKIIEFGHAEDIITIDKLRIVYGDTIKYSGESDYKEVTFL